MSYAIGPGLHDWEREKFDEEEREFSSRYGWWHLNLYMDRERKKEKKEIIEAMDVALGNMSAAASERFAVALFAWYCADNNDAKNEMYEILDEHLKEVFRKLERQRAE